MTFFASPIHGYGVPKCSRNFTRFIRYYTISHKVLHKEFP
jgi:hypothetical protein